MAKPPEAPSLADLRKEIDRIDEAMHQLLIERGEIIDRLIAVKRSQDAGTSAFRPAREAEMMRRLVKRHKGILPLDTVESIWRVIISTFTYVQAPFSVHADLSAGDALMRDSARFHFGFTVPFVPHMGAAGVVAAVSASKGDLGLVPAFDVASAGAWWSALEFDAAPKIIARLPFRRTPRPPRGLAGVRPLPGRGRRHGNGNSRVERACLWLGSGRSTGAIRTGRFHRRTRPCLRRCGLTGDLAERRRALNRSARPWLRPAPQCVRRPSSEATQPAIRLPPIRPDRSETR